MANFTSTLIFKLKHLKIIRVTYISAFSNCFNSESEILFHEPWWTVFTRKHQETIIWNRLMKFYMQRNSHFDYLVFLKLLNKKAGS
jgi:hypothetical protein